MTSAGNYRRFDGTMTHLITSCPHEIVTQDDLNSQGRYTIVSGIQSALKRYLEIRHQETTYRLLQDNVFMVWTLETLT